MISETTKSRGLSYKDFQIKVFLGVLLILFAWIMVEYTSLLYKSYQIEQKKQWFIEENTRLTNSNIELEKRYEYYKTDYFFRKEAKRKLNKKEPWDKVVIITGGDEKIASQNDWDIDQQNFEKWKEYLFASDQS